MTSLMVGVYYIIPQKIRDRISTLSDLAFEYGVSHPFNREQTAQGECGEGECVIYVTADEDVINP